MSADIILITCLALITIEDHINNTEPLSDKDSKCSNCQRRFYADCPMLTEQQEEQQLLCGVCSIYFGHPYNRGVIGDVGHDLNNVVVHYSFINDVA
jgi:predicted amidophosphoribosyltransferase